MAKQGFTSCAGEEKDRVQARRSCRSGWWGENDFLSLERKYTACGVLPHVG